MSYILSVKNLTVKLDKVEILKNLSFNIRKGEIWTILGPNGAGKTVLLKTLLGIFSYEGEIKWAKGIRIGYVPQRLPFIKLIPMTVLEFFKLKNISKDKTKEILNLLGIKNLLNQRIDYLSSGQFQRILVGWALSKDPDILLFDEPFSGIDLAGQKSIYNLLEELNKKKRLTILLVSHELSIVFKISTHVLCLNRKIICHGQLKEVLTPENLAKLYGGRIKFHKHIYKS